MGKINPLIEIPKGLIKDNEILMHLNEEVIKYKNRKKPAPAIEMYTTQTGRMFKVNDDNIMEEMHQTNHTSDPHGYKTVYFKDLNDGKYHKIKVHRAVLATFSPLPKDQLDALTVNHKKGREKDNNNTKNLELMTPEDNIRDAFAQGLANMLSNDDIKTIINLAKQGYDDEYIGKKIKRSPFTVMQVRLGKDRYKKQLKALGLSPVKTISTITDDILREIIKLANEGYTDREISDIVGVPKASVKIIRGGREGYDKRLRKIGLEPIKTKNVIPLTDDDYREIMRLAYAGVPDEEIGAKFNRSADTIKCIRNGGKRNKEILDRLGIAPIKYKVKVIRR